MGNFFTANNPPAPTGAERYRRLMNILNVNHNLIEAQNEWARLAEEKDAAEKAIQAKTSELDSYVETFRCSQRSISKKERQDFKKGLSDKVLDVEKDIASLKEKFEIIFAVQSKIRSLKDELMEELKCRSLRDELLKALNSCSTKQDKKPKQNK